MVWNRRQTIPVLLAAATLIPIGALGWLGLRILGQDRDLERQRVRENLEFAAGRLALAMERRLGDIEEQLAQGSGLRLTSAGLDPAQGPGILYQPEVSPGGAEAPAPALSEADALEHQRQDLAGAAAAWRRMAQSPTPAARAAALIGLGRVLRKQGDRPAALEAYSRLRQLGSVPVAGQPAELIARQARCRVFEEAGNAEDLRKEVADLARVLYSGAWRIDRPTFELYRDLIRRRAGPPPPAGAVARTEAAIALWRAWRADDLVPRGRRILPAEAMPVLAVWAGGPQHPTAWLAAPAELEAMLGPLWRAQQLAVSLYDADGQRFLGPQLTDTVALTPGETRLPFILRVASLSTPARAEGYRARRMVLISGLLLTFGLMLAAAYGLYRATTREMALARQQADFVSAVSHEFRTPLTSMRHLTELLASRGVADEDRKAHYYELLAHETERLHRMVESLLSFGRIEAGAYAWRLEPADASQLVRGMVEEFRREPQARGRQVLCEIDDGLPPIRADREALARALWNLLENAAKYSEPGTPIRVFARRAADSILLGVEDHGSGIPVGEQSAVFQKFVRGAKAGRAGIRGVGIGLALVKHIVEAHGGSVQLSSEPGRGSTFTLVLPCPAS